VSVELVPDAAELSATESLNSQIAKLSCLVDRAIDGNYEGDADSLAKLVTAMARLIEAKNKAEASVKPAALAALIAGMSDSVNARVAAPEVVSLIQRDWRRLSEEMAG
jgi:hypothetical protein